MYWFLGKEIEFENKILMGFYPLGKNSSLRKYHKCGHFTGYVVTLVILTKVLFWMPAIGASPTNWRSCPRHSSWVSLGVVDFFFSLTPFCFRFSNRSKTLARFLSACRWLWIDRCWCGYILNPIKLINMCEPLFVNFRKHSRPGPSLDIGK